MWAQGLTIGLLIAAGALTHYAKKDMPKEVCRMFILCHI